MYWYEEDVEQLEKQLTDLPYTPEMIFYGSSSVRMWDSLYQDYEKYKPVNLGFGGSTLEACVYFFQRIMQPYKTAKQLVVYAGDNDLGDGKEPNEVLHYFTRLVESIKQFFPDGIQVFFLSIKPSIARWDINEKIVETNRLIHQAIEQQFPEIHFINIYNSMINENGTPVGDLYVEDGLHMSVKGYERWKNILQPIFDATIPKTATA